MRAGWKLLGCLLLYSAVGLSSAKAAPGVLAQATVEVRLIIEPCVLVTDMRVMPQVLNLQPQSGNHPPTRPLVLIRLHIPTCARNVELHRDTIRLNGVLIAPIQRPFGHWQKEWGDCPGPSPDYLHLFFDRREVINILGPPPGLRVINFEATIGGGHLITATDTVQLLPPKVKIGLCGESSHPAGNWLTGPKGRTIICTLSPTNYLGDITQGVYTLTWSQ